MKYFAVVCVVVGHFADCYTNESEMYRAVYVFIYAFHMPLFIFISGLFNRRRERFPIESVVFYVVVALLIRVWITASLLLRGSVPSFSLLGDANVSWFMIALAAYMCICYVLQNAKPQTVMLIALAVACAVGYDSSLDDRFALMRIVVFFPFYYLGFVMKPAKIVDRLDSTVLLAVGIALIAGWAVLCYTHGAEVYQLRMLFTARNPYAVVPIDGCGFQHRLLCYAISALLCAAIIAVFSHVRTGLLATWGGNTLAVYFWHMGALNLLLGAGVFSWCLGMPGGKALWLLLAVVLACILSLDVFKRPLDWVQRGLKGIGE